MNIQSLKHKLTNKLSIATILLTLVWVVMDSSTRLNIKYQLKDNSSEIAEILPLEVPQLGDHMVNLLSESYAQYKSTEAVEANKQSGMSALEQANQKGELKTLFIGDNKLQLKAIIKGLTIDSSKSISNSNSKDDSLKKSSLIALILTTDVKTGQQKIEKFENNSQIYGYLLSIEKNTQVILSKKQAQQEIILTMYARK
jgi:hypothetical protein